jgi:hypothetical protein
VNRYILGLVLIVAQQVSPQSCGSSSSSMPQNMVPLALNAGPTNDAFNIAFATVTVCPPGGSNCQSIGGIMVDTGSTGLRIVSSALTVPLTPQTSNGATVVECFPFQDGFTWGPVAVADLTIGTMQAKGVPIQIIGGNGTPPPPDSCTSSGMTNEDSLQTLGANGVLGVGLFRQDCGPACTFTGSSNPGLYYACTGASCQPTPQPLAQQLQNPVWLFSSDNNGVTIQLPTVPATGQTQATGVMMFGIGTQSNNALGNATVFTLDGNGNFTTRFNQTSTTGFIDSGSNGLYFLDSATTQIPTCTDAKDFYCPATTLNLSATNTGANGRSGTVSFGIANADNLSGSFSVLPQIGGPFPAYFDWGLPFFYGRTVFTAIEGQTTPGGTGPYFAY